jgi:hypothetical protein
MYLSEVLARAKHRTKKEIGRLVRLLDPLPDVPPRIEPLGPTPAPLVPVAPTWREFVQSTCPVRELAPGDRPRDWMENDAERANDIVEREEMEAPADLEAELEAATPDRVSAPTRLTPQRYRVQFTASEEYVKLVEEARALLSRSAPRPALDALHLRAMRALVAELERQKYAVTTRPRKRPEVTTPASTPSIEGSKQVEGSISSAYSDGHDTRAVPRQRGRYVPAHVRHAVFERDNGRGTYTDSSGRRCGEAHRVEYITSSPSLNMASTASRISRSVAKRTTFSQPRRTSAEISSRSSETRRSTSRGVDRREENRRSPLLRRRVGAASDVVNEPGRRPPSTK